MADCVNLPTCPFFFDKMANMPAMSEMYKKNYCQGDSSACARFLVYKRLGSGNVPKDLFPNDMERAEQIVERATATA